MARPRIELDSRGVQAAALKSPEVRAAVRAIAEDMAGRARQAASNGNEFVVTERTPYRRAGAYVHRVGTPESGSGAAGEAQDRALGRAMGGG
jgi:hypothetical protein